MTNEEAKLAYAAACDAAAKADELGLPSEHLWAQARRLKAAAMGEKSR